MKLVLLKMEQAHPVIVKNTKENKPTLHTCTTGHQTKPNQTEKAQKFKNVKLQPMSWI